MRRKLDCSENAMHPMKVRENLLIRRVFLRVGNAESSNFPRHQPAQFRREFFHRLCSMFISRHTRGETMLTEQWWKILKRKPHKIVINFFYDSLFIGNFRMEWQTESGRKVAYCRWLVDSHKLYSLACCSRIVDDRWWRTEKQGKKRLWKIHLVKKWLDAEKEKENSHFIMVLCCCDVRS